MNSCSVSYDHMKTKQVTGKIEKNKKGMMRTFKREKPGITGLFQKEMNPAYT